MKDIPGYEGRYAITSCGRVYSHLTHKELKQQTMKNGYKHIVLLDKNQHHNGYLVHRLVALTYLPNPNNYPEVDHLDHIRSHNYINNLQWVTHKENQAFLIGVPQTEEHKRKKVESRRKNNGGKW